MPKIITMCQCLCLFACLCVTQIAKGQLLFSDNFEDSRGASVLWGNQRGAWRVESAIGAAGKGYGAGQPSNAPLTFSTMPFWMNDCVVEMDVRAADDGGVWLRADEAGLSGVLFVMAHGNVYWHHVVNGDAGAIINPANGVFSIGQTFHVRLVVTGNQYLAFVNGSQMPMTQYNTAAFSGGYAALYDFRSPNHQYDNVTLSGACPGGVCCPRFSWQPADVMMCSTGVAVLSAPLAGTGAATATREWYWAIDDIGNRRMVVEGLNLDAHNQPAFMAEGANTSTLSISLATGAQQAVFESFQCIANGACESIGSDMADVRFCASEFNCDGVVDLFDYLDFVAAFSGNEPNADFNHDTVIDFFDYLDFVASFSTGC